MLARPRQRRQLAMHGVFGFRSRRRIALLNGSERRSGERRAHQRDRSKHIGPHQRTPCGDRTAEIVPDHRVDVRVAERRYQPERVAHQIEQPEGIEVAVIISVPAGAAAVAALVRRDHVIAGLGQHRHHLAPAIGEFGKAVQQQHARPAAGLVAGFQHMQAQAVDVVDKARANAGGQGDVGEGRSCVHNATLIVMAGFIPAIHVFVMIIGQ